VTMIAAAVIQPAAANEFEYSGKNAEHYRVRKTQDEHRDRTICERESAKNYLRANVALQHHVQFVPASDRAAA